MKHIIYNHKTSSLSDIDNMVIESVTEGGNWKDIPLSVPSKRLDQIRKSGGRTTYYARLSWDKPAYTINTYFNRPGNGCFMHPNDKNSGSPQHRLLSFREAARLQSFPDNFRFFGTKTSMYKQIGNAVPPLLAYYIAKSLTVKTAIDLFCGCGGLSFGFEQAGVNIVLGNDIEKHYIETWKNNHKGIPVLGDISSESTKADITSLAKGVDIIIGGPPCQGFSTAGWRSIGDKRNKLWEDYLDLVFRIKPKYFLIENVPGLLSSTNEGISVLHNMKVEFGKLGYTIIHQKMHAEDYGVPQKRRRIFIIGKHKSVNHHYEFPEKITNNPVTVREAIQNLPSLNANDGHDEIIIKNYRSTSTYEDWLIGKTNIREFDDYLRSI